jgi:hypothetical protein
MKIKYWGYTHEKGREFKADIFDREGEPVISNISLTETVVDTSAIYISEDLLDTNNSLEAGIYVERVVEIDNGEEIIVSHREMLFDGLKELSLLDVSLLSENETMQLRDSLGIDGDKMVARNGQLQKKSEYPYNSTIDTNDIFNKE